ncbi:MAG: hypothetical protein KBS95_04990 [Alistipes sp.]|nr:hypothetical protein [Candidatus Alistipes equi]
MQDKEAEEGWMFVNFVALQWYYNLLNKLDSAKLDSLYSVKTIIGLQKDVRKVKIGDKWYTDCLTSKERKAV